MYPVHLYCSREYRIRNPRDRPVSFLHPHSTNKYTVRSLDDLPTIPRVVQTPHSAITASTIAKTQDKQPTHHLMMKLKQTRPYPIMWSTGGLGTVSIDLTHLINSMESILGSSGYHEPKKNGAMTSYGNQMGCKQGRSFIELELAIPSCQEMG